MGALFVMLTAGSISCIESGLIYVRETGCFTPFSMTGYKSSKKLTAKSYQLKAEKVVRCVRF